MAIEEKQANNEEVASLEEPIHKKGDADSQKVRIEISKEIIEELVNKYGEEYVKKILDEALKIHSFKEYKSNKCTSYSERFERLVQDLAKIYSVPRWSKFTEDPAQGNKVSLKIIDEAMAGVACEEMKLVGALERSKDAGEEFIELLEDGSKNYWDVKTFPVYSSDGKKYIFNAEVFTEKIKKGLLNGEKIIVNIAYLPELETQELVREIISSLTAEELKKIIGIDPYDAERTKMFNNSLGKEPRK